MTSGGDARIELRGVRRRGGVLSAVVVLEGASREELKRASSAAALLGDRSMLVAVDGGLTTCRAARRRPDLFVGDGDSIRRIPDQIERVVYPRDKDHSDLSGALDELKSRRAQVVAVAGMLGGRLDHEWANLLELVGRARGFAGIIAPTSRGTVIITAHGCRLRTVRGRTFSLFAPRTSSTVTLRGADWELVRRRLQPGSHGLSNVTGTDLDLTVHQGTAMLVLLPTGSSS